jgi:eukaryotic-like serine/threonine-protein kinase
MSLAPGSRIGSYEVLSSIGAGGMGEVYLATDTRLHRDVALKIVSEIFEADREHLSRFEREAQVLASLNHPNIAHIYGLEQKDAVHALVMAFVPGRTLSGLLPAAGGGMAIDEALSIARQIADGLEAAHER